MVVGPGKFILAFKQNIYYNNVTKKIKRIMLL